MPGKIMSAVQLEVMLNNLEHARQTLKAHLAALEDEQSLYNQTAIYNIGKAYDGVVDALIGLRGE